MSGLGVAAVVVAAFGALVSWGFAIANLVEGRISRRAQRRSRDHADGAS